VGSVGAWLAMIKRFFFLSVMMSAVGVPYLLSSSAEWAKTIKSRFTTTSPAAQTAAPVVDTGAPAWGQGTALPSLAPGKAMPIEGYGRYDLAEVLNFEATPQWVMSRWPRITSGLADPNLQGYRVPLITGTGDDDLAGSLTYYFDKEQKLKVIHFRGTTGNPHKLVSLVTSRYGLSPQTSSDPGLYLYQAKWNGKPTSELRIRPAQIVRASQPHSRFQVEMAMKRP
jgi:Family of unknown function (DUF6690)